MVVNSEPQVFLFLSQILGDNVVDDNGTSLGKIIDVVASLTEPYPIITHMLLKGAQKKPFSLPWQRVNETGGNFVADPQYIEDFREPVLQGGGTLA